MAGSSEQPHSTSIFEHYSGFDTNPTHSPTARPAQFAHLRRESEFSVLSSNASSNQHHVNLYPGHPESSIGAISPHIAPSIKSSSSSLRHTVAMLKAGVFPPGIQRRRERLDSDSDASHYDDDDDHGFDVVEGSGPFGSKPGSVNASLQHHNDNLEEQEVFSNAPDSPFVPRRISSVNSATPSHHSRSPPSKQSSPPEVISRSGKGSPVGLGVDEAIKSRFNSDVPSPPPATIVTPPTYNKSTSPDARGLSTKVEGKGARDMETTPSSSSAALSQSKEIDLERQLAIAADHDDPNRPKTLKEARALAKERARLRLQAREASDMTILGPAVASPTKATPIERPELGAQRESFQSDRSDYSAPSGEGHERGGKGSMDWRGHSRQRATPITPGEEQEGRQLSRMPSSPEKDTEQGTMMASTSSMMAMEDLKSAVGEALEDVSFASSATTTTTALPTDPMSGDYDDPIPTTKLEIPMRGEGEIESSNHSVNSFDSARESPAMSASMTTSIPTWVSPEVPKPKQIPTSTTQSSFPSSGGAVSNSPSIEVISGNRFVPHALHTQQRSTAPNKIARLDVYGKSVPWPPAFNPAAIIDQNRLAPWERARSYAHYCNDIASTQSGLMVWMEMVQRPAQRIVQEPATPVKRHGHRGEGTDHSAYAASVRSDATFPMRGDGGKAKELMSTMPATISESPPSTLPNNIPYPTLVQQATRSSSSSQDDMASSSIAAIDRERLVGRSGNFFSSLGRKGSTRRTPGSGSMTGFSSLSGSNTASTVRGAMRGKGKTISNPINLSSSPSQVNVKAANETLTANESVASPSTISRGQLPSSPSHTTLSAQPARMPMGPRAPLSSGAFPSSINVGSRRDSIPNPEKERKTSPYGLSTTGGIYNVPASTTSPMPVGLSGSPTDYSSGEVKSPISPPLGSVKSSFSYNSVREKSPRSNFATLQAPPIVPKRNSSDGSNGSRNGSRSRRGSQQQGPQVTSSENEALDKLSDVLPDAERSTLLEYLRRANGNDLIAIGDYLQAQSKNEGKRLLR